MSSLSGDQAACLRLCAVLDFGTVMQQRAEGLRLLQGKPDKLSIDCAAVQVSNTAGVLLLLSLARAARQAQVPLALLAVPDVLQRLLTHAEVAAAILGNGAAAPG